MEIRQKNSVDQTYYIVLRDSNGDPITTLTFASAGLSIEYAGERLAAVAITPVTQTITGAHTDGGFCHVTKGMYRIDAPDATQAVAGNRVRIAVAATGVKTEWLGVLLPVDDVYAAAATENQIADAILKRDWTAVTGEAARSLLNALRFLRNRRRVNAGTLTVYKEDDTTSAWSGPVTGTPAVTEIDPT